MYNTKQNLSNSETHPVTSCFGVSPSESHRTVVDFCCRQTISLLIWNHFVGGGISRRGAPRNAQVCVSYATVVHAAFVPEKQFVFNN